VTKEVLPTIKRQSIKTLPRHLMICLKRFDFDYEVMQQVKINERLEFPHEVTHAPSPDPSSLHTCINLPQVFNRQDLLSLRPVHASHSNLTRCLLQLDMFRYTLEGRKDAIKANGDPTPDSLPPSPVHPHDPHIRHPSVD
jgi:hypothetical protein